MKKLLLLLFLCQPLWAASGDTLLVFPAQACHPETTNGVSLDERNDHTAWAFNDTTDQELLCEAVLPRNYAGGGLTVSLYLAFATATSGTAGFQADIERIQAGTLDIDADSFTGTFQAGTATAPGTSGIVVVLTITFTNGAQMDSLAVGEAFRLKIRRDADGTDTVAGNAQLLAVEVKET